MRPYDFLDRRNAIPVDRGVCHNPFFAPPTPLTATRNSSESVLLYLGSWLTVYMNLQLALRALANERRLLILAWLRQPTRHFPVQVDGDLLKDGVCGLSIARKLRVSQPTASEHLKILTRAGLIRGKRIKQWIFYRRDEARIRKIKKLIVNGV